MSSPDIRISARSFKSVILFYFTFLPHRGREAELALGGPPTVRLGASERRMVKWVGGVLLRCIWANTAQTRGWTPWHVVLPTGQSKQSRWIRRNAARGGWGGDQMPLLTLCMCVFLCASVLWTLRTSVMTRVRLFVCVSRGLNWCISVCFVSVREMCPSPFGARIVGSVSRNQRARMSSLWRGI